MLGFLLEERDEDGRKLGSSLGSSLEERNEDGWSLDYISVGDVSFTGTSLLDRPPLDFVFSRFILSEHVLRSAVLNGRCGCTSAIRVVLGYLVRVLRRLVAWYIAWGKRRRWYLA